MTYIKRAIEDAFLQMQSEYPVILLTGARLMGKTTITKHIY